MPGSRAYIDDIRISKRTVAWRLTEIQDWIELVTNGGTWSARVQEAQR